MLLTQTAEYALRAMTCLAAADGSLISSDHLAEDASIPRHYVNKVMRQLVVAELVSARRGRGGGFWLARPADQIRFADILEAVGGYLDPDHCAYGHAHCNAADPCPLHDSYVELQAAFSAWAASTTLDTADTSPLHGRRPPRKKPA